MFKRIKNLLDISRYSVEDLQRGKIQYNPTLPEPEVNEVKLATILNLENEDPFKDIENETTEQPPNDTTTRD